MNSEEALCLDLFDKFSASSTFSSITTQFQKLCKQARIRPTRFPDFFPKLQKKLTSKDAQQFLSTYEKKVQNPSYQRGTICRDLRVLIIGAGPSGLRCAIECQLLGAKVVLIEKRDDFSRNNVLHIWPFVIQDLKSLGAKRFYPKFCAGSINHISISQLQHVLLKIALLLGVEVYGGVGFEKLVEPKLGKRQQGDDEAAAAAAAEAGASGWQICCELEDDSDLDTISSVESQYFDVIIGANGRQCNLPGFRRKALRAKLAIAITANFINRHTAGEARVQEISGVSFIYRQSFFEELYDLMGIELENIVYYKDETHYFIMTAKKSSLLMKGVLKQDFADTDDLLRASNINKTALKSYILEAVSYATDDKLPDLEFALNYRGEPDFSVFDFTSMYASENASKILERNGRRLVLALAGDSLLEPFWPMGTGCARGFLSALDTAWLIRSLAKGNSPLDIISERECIFKLLAQTTQENLNRNYANYSVDPHSRYQNIHIHIGKPYPTHIQELYDTGNGIGVVGDGSLNQKKLVVKSDQITSSNAAVVVEVAATAPAPPSASASAASGGGSLVHGQDQRSQSHETKTEPSGDEYESKITSVVLNNSSDENDNRNRNTRPAFPTTNVISKSQSQSQSLHHQSQPQLGGGRVRQAEEDLESKSMSEKIDFLMEWIQSHVKAYRIEVRGIHDLFVRGDALCCLLHAFRRDLIPQYPFPPDVEEGIELMDAAAFRNQLAFDFLKQEYGITCTESGLNSTFYSNTNVPDLVDFLTQIYKVFKDESPRLTSATATTGTGASATAAPTSSYRRQRQNLWEPNNNQPSRSGVTMSNFPQSIRRSATMSSANEAKFKRGVEYFKNNPPSCESSSSRRERTTDDVQSANSNYSYEKSPDRSRKLAEAEYTKEKALQFINSLKDKRAEERKVKKAATIKAIQSLEGGGSKLSKPPPKPALTPIAVPAPSSSVADACSSASQSTLEQDDFFNEYNMRLWRKSVPTIQERSQKLENNILESAGLKKTPVVSNSIKQTVAARMPSYAGKINEQALSIMQQRFAAEKGYTNNVHVQPKALTSSKILDSPTLKKSTNTLNTTPQPNKASNQEIKPKVQLESKSKPDAYTNYNRVEPHSSNQKSNPKVQLESKSKPDSNHNLVKSDTRRREIDDLDEEELAKAMFSVPTNRRDGKILSSSIDNDIDLDDLKEEFDEDVLNDLSRAEVNEILTWSGKYL